MLQKIIVTGGSGQLGQEFQFLAKKYPKFQFDFLDSASLDITDNEKVNQYFVKNKPFACINCAAHTAVDKAESETDLAHKINAIGAENLAKASKKSDTILIQISTDFVFDGSSSKPLKEEDEAKPISVYGATKLAGEKLALQNNPKTLVLRTSWLYSTFGNNFVKTMQKLTRERESLNVIFDQIGTPTYARDLAETILNILSDSNLENKFGIYHYSNEGVTSWYDFAVEISKLSKNTCDIQPIETFQYPTPAKRPAYSVLNKAKIKSVFGIKIPHWKESLEKCIKSM